MVLRHRSLFRHLTNCEKRRIPARSDPLPRFDLGAACIQGGIFLLMAGSPIKHERTRIVRAAFLKALEREGVTPEDALKPIAEKIIEQAQGGDIASFRELADRLVGKPAQQLVHSGDSDAPLVARIVREVTKPGGDPDAK